MCYNFAHSSWNGFGLIFLNHKDGLGYKEIREIEGSLVIKLKKNISGVKIKSLLEFDVSKVRNSNF